MSSEKKATLSRNSAIKLLSADVVHDGLIATIAFYQSRTHGGWGVGIDALSALDCWGIGLPGFKGMNLQPDRYPDGLHAGCFADTGGSETLHFPDETRRLAAAGTQFDSSAVPAAVPRTRSPHGWITASSIERQTRCACV